ncbi:MAG: universal stress protein [Desulfobulbus sp.]|nr:universal stress protein [Desulfobulbus sp.]
MERLIVLAHDGSINADWLTEYALQFAGSLPNPQLFLLHILDNSFTHERITEKFTAISLRCSKLGINCTSLIREKIQDVFSALLASIPSGQQTFCLCGARIAPRGRGFIAGTISERLLRSAPCNVIAIRVVSPGMLGHPSTLLFPLAGHPRGFRSALPFLELLLASVRRLFLLRVMTVHPLHFRYISNERAQNKILAGFSYLNRVTAEIREHLTLSAHLDRRVLLSDDWAKEILIQAGKLNASMVLLGATERSLPHRFIYGNRIEQILRSTPCDIALYRKG